MSDKLFSIECDEGECTIWFKKPYHVDISKEALEVAKENNSLNNTKVNFYNLIIFFHNKPNHYCLHIKQDAVHCF